MEERSVRLHQLCSCCKPPLLRSKLLRASRQHEPEKFLIHQNLESLDRSVEDGCHFCTHLGAVIEQGFERTVGRRFPGEIHIDIVSNPSDSVRPQVLLIAHFTSKSEIAAISFQGNLHLSYQSGADHGAHPLWNAPEQIPDLAINHQSTGSKAHKNLAKRWVQECRQNHTECKPRAVSEIPTRLLEVDTSNEDSIRLVTVHRDMYIADCPHTVEYCCLTHRWGHPADLIKLTLSNSKQFQHGIPLASLPKSFRDAVAICQHLKISCLWIDSLCIIQDSESDWLTESRKMDSIFEGAICTIAAAGAQDPQGGCFALRNPLLISKCRLPKSQLYICANKDSTLDVSEARSKTPLARRGWIFQERLLSHRTLTFGEHGLHWHCARGAATEQDPDGWGLVGDYSAYVDRIFGPSAPASNWKPWPQGFTFSAMSPFLSLLERQWKDWTKKPSSRDAYCFHRDWMSIVAAYSDCELTKSKDKLTALTGIVNRVEDFASSSGISCISSKDAHHFGVWIPTILLDLLWHRDGPYDGSHPTNSAFPSWSWASVNGRVKSALLSYPAELVIESIPCAALAFIDGHPHGDLQEVRLHCHMSPADIAMDRTSVSTRLHLELLTLSCYIDNADCGDLKGCQFLPFFIQPNFIVGLLVTRHSEMHVRRIGLAIGAGQNKMLRSFYLKLDFVSIV